MHARINYYMNVCMWTHTCLYVRIHVYTLARVVAMNARVPEHMYDSARLNLHACFNVSSFVRKHIIIVIVIVVVVSKRAEEELLHYCSTARLQSLVTTLLR